MINRVILVGRTTRDPILRKTQSGMSVVSFILACNRRVKKGEQQEADFINCVAWNKTADFMAQYVKKGVLLGVDGRMQTRNYNDNTGKKVYVTEVVAEHVQSLESKKDAQNVPYTPQETNYGTEYEEQGFSSGDTLDIASDDLPF